MFRFTTGEGWEDLIFVLSKDKTTPGHECIDNPTYSDYVSAGHQPVGCGKKYIKIFYFCYIGMIAMVFMNLFMAIIINSYFHTRDQVSFKLNEETYFGF